MNNQTKQWAGLTPFLACVPTVIFSITTTDTMAQLRLPHLVGDGMVVQRHARIPVWGSATPGDTVTVSLAGNVETTAAEESGAWQVVLPALEAGGPYTLLIDGSRDRREIQDVLVGDVWVASGQSNMEWVLRDAVDSEAEIAEADDRMIRHFKVPRSWAWQPESDLAGGSWEAASPATAGDFTAVGYFFAQELRKHVDVPIGLINTTWGGSAIEAWMSAPSMGMTDDEQARLEDLLRAEAEQTLARLKSLIGDFPTSDAGLVDGVAYWANPEMDDSDWAAIEVPSLWESAGYNGMNGVAWYRTTFQLTPEQAAQGATLSLGTIDDSDITWVNGEQVGSMIDQYNRSRIYSVSPSILHAGENTIAVRVEDPQGGGGIYGDPALVFLEVGGAEHSLAGEWKFRPAMITVDLDDEKHHAPTLLFNKMLRPLFNAPVTGAIWYQGETNAWDSLAFVYRDRLMAMVGDWRSGWKLETMPFFVVQLPNYMEAKSQPSESGWATLRESQLRILELPKTGVAVTIDVGKADDIHPPDKKPVGVRLARAARAVAYGEDIVYSGPIYRSHEVKDGRVYVAFDHAGSGLTARNGKLHEFAIAGADRRFVWAEAEIEDDRVVVWSSDIEQPVAVRYAWADNPERANLYNREGLPASPFRTDEW